MKTIELSKDDIDPRQQLAVAVENSGLEPSSAQSLKAIFDPLFEQADALRTLALAINVTDASQTDKMAEAHKLRLLLRDVRVAADKAHQAAKLDTNRKGKAIDGIRNIIKYFVEPLEETLLEHETFAQRQEQARIDAITTERAAALHHYGVDTQFIDLGAMPENVYAKMLQGAEEAVVARKVAEERAEADRVAAAKAKREQEEYEERERYRIEQENKALREEAAKARRLQEAAEAEAKAARDAADEVNRKRAAELLQAKDAEEASEAVIQRQRVELEEIQNLQRQTESLVARERETSGRSHLASSQANMLPGSGRTRGEELIQAMSPEDAKLVADTLDQQLQYMSATAPDSDKIAAFAKTVRALKVPDMATADGKRVAADIAAKVEGFANWILKNNI